MQFLRFLTVKASISDEHFSRLCPKCFQARQSYWSWNVTRSSLFSAVNIYIALLREICKTNLKQVKPATSCFNNLMRLVDRDLLQAVDVAGTSLFHQAGTSC